MIYLKSMQVIGLYLFLKEKEGSLDLHLKSLYKEIENILYEKLSIDELENINKIYNDKVDILSQRDYF